MAKANSKKRKVEDELNSIPHNLRTVCHARVREAESTKDKLKAIRVKQGDHVDRADQPKADQDEARQLTSKSPKKRTS